MSNSEILNLKLNQIKAHTQALVEQIDLNPVIDECVEILMAEQVTHLSLQVQQRMNELRMSPQTLNLKAKVSKLELSNLLICKSLPSLKALWSIAQALNCELSITAIPSRQTRGMRIDTQLRPDFNEQNSQASLKMLTQSITQLVQGKLGSAMILTNYEESFDSFFSTRYLFRSAVSRLYSLKLDLKPASHSWS